MDTQPANYVGAFDGVPNPVQSFTQGLQSGVATQYAGLQQQMQQYQFQRAQQMQRAALQVAQNPTPESLAQLSIAFPEMGEQFKRSFDMLQPAQQQAHLKQGIPVYAAVLSGRYDVAANALRDQATAMTNSGDEAGAKATNTIADIVEQHPDQAKFIIGLHLASALGPDKFKDTFSTVGDQTRTQELFPATQEKVQAEADVAGANAQTQLGRNRAEIQKIQTDATTAAGRLQLDRDALMSGTQERIYGLQLQYGMPDDASKALINKAAMDATAGEQTSSRYLDLATKMEQASRTTGFIGTAAEAFKAATGVENGQTALKQEYARIVNTGALSTIKDALGGRVTDVDMKTAMSVVPGPNASTEAVVSYLRGVAKISQINAATQEAQAEWLAQQGRAGTLGPAVKDLSIMGTQVPKGTTFADFSRQFIQKKAAEITAQSALVQAQGRSYMRFAAPQPGDAAAAPAGQ